MLFIDEKVSFRLNTSTKYYMVVYQKLTEFDIMILKSTPYVSKIHDLEFESWFWTCQTNQERFDALCKWLNEDFDGYAHISKNISPMSL